MERARARAQSQIANANKVLAEAEDDLRAAQRDEEDLERLVAVGMEQMDRAEENYELMRDGPSAGHSSPDETQDN